MKNNYKNNNQIKVNNYNRLNKNIIANLDTFVI